MKKTISILLLLGSITLSAQTETITLWQCISAGIENFQVQQNQEYNSQSVDLQKQSLKTNFYPVIKLNGQATYQSTAIEINLPIPGIEMPSVPLDQYKAYLEINQMIYDGGLTKSYSNLLSLSNTENISKSSIQEIEIGNNIAKIFFLALLLDKQEEIINNQLKTLNEQLKIVDISVKNNILTPVNRDILQSEILKVEQKFDETKILKSSTIKVLEQFTGQTYNSDVDFLFPDLSINQTDTSISPRIELFDIQSQKLEIMDNQISATRRPQVYAFAQGGYGRPGLNMLSDEFSPYFIAGVSFSWRIYDWNNANRNRQINAIKTNQINIEKDNTQIGITVQKENILAQINSLEQSIDKDKQIIILQENILKTYNSQLKNGIITSSEYVIEVNKLSQAQLTLELHKIQVEQLKYEYNNVY
ncbi:MAG: TolC family protein [Bacteroidales bacterium]|nr:TolC family protein [Bacteroidales bacterium]